MAMQWQAQSLHPLNIVTYSKLLSSSLGRTSSNVPITVKLIASFRQLTWRMLASPDKGSTCKLFLNHLLSAQKKAKIVIIAEKREGRVCARAEYSPMLLMTREKSQETTLQGSMLQSSMLIILLIDTQASLAERTPWILTLKIDADSTSQGSKRQKLVEKMYFHQVDKVIVFENHRSLKIKKQHSKVSSFK